MYFDIDEATAEGVTAYRSDKNPPVVNIGLTTDNGLLIGAYSAYGQSDEPQHQYPGARRGP